MTIGTSRWEAIVDKAYDTWQNRSWTYAQFLATLDAKERQAVLLGNMNGQICNGGVQQWVDNGYACHAEDLLDVLSLMDTPRATEWAEKLGQFVKQFVNTNERKTGFANGNYWKHDLERAECHRRYDYEGDDEDEEDNEAYKAAEMLDDFYYEEPFHAEFIAEIESFIAE